MQKRCPYCQSFGVLKHRRPWWRRLARRPHTYSCIDCGASLTQQQTLAPASPLDTPPTPAAPRLAGLTRALRRMGPAASRLRGRLTASTGVARRLLQSAERTLEGELQRVGISPIRVWVVKQVDADILHLCGIGTLEPQQRPWAALSALRGGRYQGGVRLGKTGIVLNSRLFATLIPQEDLRLEGRSRAHWRGQAWQVAQVPQRSWQYEGRLVAQSGAVGGHPCLISGEDVSSLRDHMDPDSPAAGEVSFQPGILWGDPLVSAWKARGRRRSGRDDD